eukprot:3958018-Prymnesium_polylepis.1
MHKDNRGRRRQRHGRCRQTQCSGRGQRGGDTSDTLYRVVSLYRCARACVGGAWFLGTAEATELARV